MDLVHGEEHKEFAARLTDKHIHQNGQDVTFVKFVQQVRLIHLYTIAVSKHLLEFKSEKLRGIKPLLRKQCLKISFVNLCICTMSLNMIDQ